MRAPRIDAAVRRQVLADALIDTETAIDDARNEIDRGLSHLREATAERDRVLRLLAALTPKAGSDEEV